MLPHCCQPTNIVSQNFYRHPTIVVALLTVLSAILTIVTLLTVLSAILTRVVLKTLLSAYHLSDTANIAISNHRSDTANIAVSLPP